MTLQEAKDQIAKEYNYDSWRKMELDYFRDGMQGMLLNPISKAAELYAESKAKEAFEAARERLHLTEGVESKFREIYKMPVKYPDYETYKTKQNA